MNLNGLFFKNRFHSVEGSKATTMQEEVIGCGRIRNRDIPNQYKEEE